MTTTSPSSSTSELVALAKRFGLDESELERFLKVIGREPTVEELAIAGAMWSEHCSYKSSKVHLSRLHTAEPWVVQGPGENAGVIEVENNWCVAFKMESHNHPSFIEPYQGAATGVGGILRDVFCMGARPIANMNCLRFGEGPRTAALVKGCVEGIGDYGNSVGVPTVTGQTSFDAGYSANILVNAFTLGVIHKDRIFKGTVGKASASTVAKHARATLTPGTTVDGELHATLFPDNTNLLVYFGSATGRDGVHGATMSSAEFSHCSKTLRPTVQVGDPFAEKQLLEATLALLKEDLVVGLQDMGAAGLTSSGIEMAGRSGLGVTMDLDMVPKRAERMLPWEILLSESQERMLAAVEPRHILRVTEVLQKFDLPFAVVGAVNHTGHFVCVAKGKICVALAVKGFDEATPKYNHAIAPRDDYAASHQSLKSRGTLVAREIAALAADNRSVEDALKTSRNAFDELLAHPQFCSRAPLTTHYCSTVQGNTVAGCGAFREAAAAVIRLPRESQNASGELGIALAAGCNELWVEKDPFHGTALSLLTLSRKIVASGGVPRGLTDCMNFGSMKSAFVARQFSDAVDALTEVGKALQIPVVSGNVSLNNQTDGRAIPPTPMLGLVGVVPRVTKTAFSHLIKKDFIDSPRYTLVRLFDKNLCAQESFATSQVRWHVAGDMSGELPAYNLKREKDCYDVLRNLHAEFSSKLCVPVGSAGLLITLFEIAAKSDAHFQPGSALTQRGLRELFSAGRLEFVVGFGSSAEASTFAKLSASAGFEVETLGVLSQSTANVANASELERFINSQQSRSCYFNGLKAFFEKGC